MGDTDPTGPGEAGVCSPLSSDPSWVILPSGQVGYCEHSVHQETVSVPTAALNEWC